MYLFLSLQFLAAIDKGLPSSHLLNVSGHPAFGHPVFLLPVLAFYVDVTVAYLRWSLLATWPRFFHL
jgi:hypothetical protein